LQTALDEIAARTDRAPSRLFKREIEPAAQVAARGQVDGPGVHGGVDVRGDGSTEAWVGRWRRSVVAQKRKETAYKALRRGLGPS
jgi:hypothetical protein